MIQPWFSAAKFGIFIHWGIYAVGGREASWAFHLHNTEAGKTLPGGTVDYPTYMQQATSFTASSYDPRAWARLFKKAGARYAVLTTKHHDGVALWNTAANDLSVVQKTPAARDLVSPFCEAMRAEGLKIGLYFSHPDWSHPDYSPTLHDPLAWQRFLAFHRRQVLELCTQFHPDLLWFDGGHEPAPAHWNFPQLAQEIRTILPQITINDRFGNQGDYKTPEQGLPLWPPEGPWEFCATMNHQWGFSYDETQYKPAAHLTRTLAEVAGMGGNFLLNVGPREDGTIPEESIKRLETIGNWLEKNAAAIFDAAPGLPAGYFNGATTVSPDRQTVYAILFDRPWKDVAIKGICNKIKGIRALGSARQLPFSVVGGAPWHGVPGVLWVEVPAEVCDELGTVLAIELEGELRVYERGVNRA